MSHRHEEVNSLLRGAVGGMTYGLVAAAVSHPFDTLKCQMQTGTPIGLGRRGLSGVLGLYRGVGPAAAASILFRTVPFICYETVTVAFHERHVLDGAPCVVAFIGGAVGGTMRGCLETPAEVVKTRLQVGASWNRAALFQGLGSTCLRNACVIGSYWVIFESTRTVREVLPVNIGNFVGGGLCAVGAWALIYPLDTAKSRIQATHYGSQGVFGQLTACYRSSGIKGLYSGLSAGLVRAFLANGAGMVAYGFVARIYS